MKGVKSYECQSNSLTEEVCTRGRTFAKENNISLEKALDIFYHSELYKLMSEGVSDMHCMSDEYLVQELEEEINIK